MCFRPSALLNKDDTKNIQTGTCQECGQPVAASVGIISGTCPYCGKPIPLEEDQNKSIKNIKIS